MSSTRHQQLLEHLTTLDEQAIAELLRSRPDVLAPPWPATLPDLAAGLLDQDSILDAFTALPTPHVELLGALSLIELLGQPASPEVASRWLDAPIETLTPLFDAIVSRALGWWAGGGVVQLCARFQVGGQSLGGPVMKVLELASLTTLRAVAAKLSVRGDGPKPEVMDRLSAVYSDADAVRALVESAPAAERQFLWECVEGGAQIEYVHHLYSPYGSRAVVPQGKWSVDRGLLWPMAEGVAYMPLEVTMALRGDGWVLPFHPDPPELGTAAVDSGLVESEAGARLLRMIERVVKLIDIAAAEPIPLLKSGGIGVRTYKLLAKQLGAEVFDVECAVRLAEYADLLVPAEPPPPVGRGRAQKLQPSPGLIPSDEAEVWRNSSAQAQGVLLLSVWWDLDIALSPDVEIADMYSEGSALRRLRAVVAEVYAATGPGTAVTGDVLPSVLWQSPVISASIAERTLPATLAEAELMGVLALGSATSLARALIGDGDLHSAVEALTEGAETSVTIGTDLTAVVFGPPDGRLARFLDTAADRESQGAATTWRFTAESVRRAFDNGADASALVARLEDVAATGVPQALSYMIKDVSRKHGHVSVSRVGSVVVSEDHALLLEIASNRKLAKLEMWSIAPTVVGSTGDAETLLTQLRAAGYAPVLRDSDGQVGITRSGEQTEPAPEFLEYRSPRRFDADAEFLAARVLMGMPEGATPQEFEAELPKKFGWAARRNLSLGSPSIVDYRGLMYAVHSAKLYGDRVLAWDMNAGDYQEFLIDELEPGPPV